MKKLMTSMLAILSLFMFTTQDDTDFDLSKIEYLDDSIVLTLKMTSDNIMAINHDLTYDTSELELVKVDPNKYFTYTEGKEVKDHNKTTINMLFDSTSAFKTVEYATIYFRPKHENQTAEIKIDNIKSADLDYKLDTSYGSIFQITTKDAKARVVKEELDLYSQLRSFVLAHKVILFSIFGGFLVLCFVIRLIKRIVNHSRKHKKPFKEVTKKKDDEPKPYFTDQKNFNPDEENENEEAFNELLEEEQDAKEENISDDILKGKYEVFVLLLLVGSLIFMSTAYAKAFKEGQLEKIRENIVNKKEYDEELDINNDKVIDVVDIIYSIDIEDVKNKGYIKFYSSEDEKEVTKKEETTTEPTTTNSLPQ